MEKIEDLKQRFEALSKKKSELESQKIQLTTKEQVLEEEVSKLTAQLKEEFGLNSLEEAEGKIKSLTEETEAFIKEAEDKLASFES